MFLYNSGYINISSKYAIEYILDILDMRFLYHGGFL